MRAQRVRRRPWNVSWESIEVDTVMVLLQKLAAGPGLLPATL